MAPAVMQRFLGAFTTGDMQAVSECYSEDALLTVSVPLPAKTWIQRLRTF